MDDDERAELSKFVSYVLRHAPGSIGIELDTAGWVDTQRLLEALKTHHRPVDKDELQELVEKSSKQRFALSDDGARIRANQGHSVAVKLNYAPTPPPEVLFHGTVGRFVPAIRSEGLLAMQRHHVHLSADVETAQAVGGRRGQAIILRVLAGQMATSGYRFYLSENQVWLCDHVPARFIEFPPGA